MNKTGKKTFSKGIDALLTPTSKQKEQKEIITVLQQQDTNEQLISICFRLPLNLKREIEHYCTDKRIKQQELIMNAVRKYLNENK